MLSTLDRRLKQDSLQLQNIPANAVLDILVENNGRINYGPFLNDNLHGITQSVSINGTNLSGWKMYQFPFEDLKRWNFAGKKASANPHFTKALSA